MTEEYEYKLLTNFLYLRSGSKRIFDLTKNHVQDAFIKNLEKRTKTMIDPYLDDGWQVISHNFTLLDNVLFLSIFVRRRCT
jgi:hypothetical protein